MRRYAVLLLCLLCAALLCPAAAETAETPSVPFNDSFYNPFMGHANDPWLVRGEGEDVFYCTGIRLYHAKNITGLMSAIADPDCLKTMQMLPDQTEVWAPEIHHYQGHWYYFYAADYNTDNVQHRMYVVKSKTDDPMGEWETPVKLDLPDGEWSIDGTFFEYRDGRIFFIWSGWRDEKQGTSQWKQYLYIVQLVTGDPTKVQSTERVMISKPRYYWEMSVQPQNEGPAVLVSPDGTYYCMYSGNYSASNEYVVAALRLNGDPLDPAAWEKLSRPVLESNTAEEIYAPGHASFIKSPDGTEDWIIFHTAKSDLSGWQRNGRAQRISWVNDTPVIDGILPNDELIPLPSGEIVDRLCIQMEDGVWGEGITVTEGLTTTPVITYDAEKAGADIVLRAPAAGTYAVYLRHNSTVKENTQIRFRVNDDKGESIMNAVWSNSEKQFVMDCVLLELREGINTVSIRCPEGMSADLAIFDRTPVKE